MQIPNPILRIELNPNLSAQARRTTIESTRLHTRHVGHDLKLRVQGRPALSAEEVLVAFAGGAFDVPGLGGAGGDFEVFAGNDRVGCVCCACPLLAVSAVAEGCGRG